MATSNSKFEKAIDLQEVEFQSISTTYPLLDELFSIQGGMLEGRLIYVTGVSGAGKTTLMLQLQSRWRQLKSCQYNRESRVAMVKSRNPQFEYHNNLYMVDETHFASLEEFLDDAEKENFDLLVIDSLRAAAHGMDGGKLQREINALMMAMEWVKRTGKNVLFIGMVNRDDEFAGSNDLMHYADAHLHLQFDKKANERYMYFDQKNRDGHVQNRVYYFFNDQGILEFMSEAEWLTQKRNVKLHSMVQDTMEGWIKGWKNHPNYSAFRKELSSAQKKVAKKGGFSSQTHFQAAMMVEIQQLVDKHF